jgi:hypothetical protein
MLTKISIDSSLAMLNVTDVLDFSHRIDPNEIDFHVVVRMMMSTIENHRVNYSTTSHCYHDSIVAVIQVVLRIDRANQLIVRYASMTVTAMEYLVRV